ncbi:hypothetical protein D5086_006346 [Populus alba]|uniref:Uncharacterized protein n=1 Tax=Populus alba TaxID=43335 RepID=A0ACC4CMG9_POPAL
MRGSPSSSTAQSPCLKGSISSPPSSSASFEDSLLFTLEEPGMNMAYEGPGVDFGTLHLPVPPRLRTSNDEALESQSFDRINRPSPAPLF